MSDHDIQRHWKIEVHQRLQDGATSLRLKDIEDETGVSVLPGRNDPPLA
jgi:hypothetical protein